MSRDALLYVADMVAAGDAVSRYADGVTFGAFEVNDEKRAAARLPDAWKQRLPEVPWRKIVGLRNMLARPGRRTIPSVEPGYTWSASTTDNGRWSLRVVQHSSAVTTTCVTSGRSDLETKQ